MSGKVHGCPRDLADFNGGAIKVYRRDATGDLVRTHVLQFPLLIKYSVAKIPIAVITIVQKRILLLPPLSVDIVCPAPAKANGTATQDPQKSSLV